MNAPDKHFNTIWVISMINVIAITAMLLLDAPRTVITHYAIGAFTWFLSAEIAAGGGWTKTRWLFYKFRLDWLRVFIGVWMGLIMFFAFPDHWTFKVVAAGFILWLPAHYSKKGARGPVDWLVGWIKRLLGL